MVEIKRKKRVWERGKLWIVSTTTAVSAISSLMNNQVYAENEGNNKLDSSSHKTNEQNRKPIDSWNQKYTRAGQLFSSLSAIESKKQKMRQINLKIVYGTEVKEFALLFKCSGTIYDRKIKEALQTRYSEQLKGVFLSNFCR